MVNQLRKRHRDSEIQACAGDSSQGVHQSCADYRPAQLVRTDSNSTSISEASTLIQPESNVYLLNQTEQQEQPQPYRHPPAWLGDPSEFMRTITRAINGEVPAASNHSRHQLPTIIVDKEMEDRKEHVCTLCFETANEGEILTRLPCGHVFHKGIDRHINADEANKQKHHTECRGILRWLRSNNTCPQCRVSIEAEQVPFVKIQQELKSGKQQFYAIPVPIVVPILHMQRQMIRRQNAMIRSQQQSNEILRIALQQAHNKRGHEMIYSNKNTAKTIINNTLSDGNKSATDENGADSENSPYTWQCPAKDFVDRMKIVVEVMELARKMHLESTAHLETQDTDVEQKLYLLAKKMEAYMYRSAPTKEVYLNRDTLEKRLTSTINQWGLMQGNQARPESLSEKHKEEHGETHIAQPVAE